MDDDHIAYAMSDRIAREYISDFMNADFEVVGKSMRLIFSLIRMVDCNLSKFLQNARMEPFFATSWLLTWFAHDLTHLDDVARLYDAILCSHPLFIYYLCAAVSIFFLFLFYYVQPL
jgi:hypothetical protein